MGGYGHAAMAALTVVNGMNEQKRMNKIARGYEEQADNVSLEVNDEVIAIEQNFEDQLSILDSSFAGRGVSVNQDGTMQALRQREKKVAQKDTTKVRAMGANKKQQLRLGAYDARAKGKQAMTNALIQGAGQGTKAYSFYADPKITFSGTKSRVGKQLSPSTKQKKFTVG